MPSSRLTRHSRSRSLGLHVPPPTWCQVVYGPSMTSLAFDLAHALEPTLTEADDVYLSRSEHDANVAPWLHMAHRRGCTVRWVPLLPDSCSLHLDALEHSLRTSPGRPALLALGAAANATGTCHDVVRAVALAKAHGARYTIVDAVHYAPHYAIDVQAFDPWI